MNEVITKDIKIENMIYEIRGKQVMLDSDLAKLYQCKNGTKTINQAVGRHIDRFPEDFYFQLNKYEFENLRSQLGTAKNKIRTLPYVFTEEGVAMLSTILRTEVASRVSIDIMRAFVSMRKYISTNLIEQKYINNLVLTHEDNFKEVYQDIRLLQESFDKLEEKKRVNEIYFQGQIYDAYSKIIEIFNTAIDELIIIDRYADITILDMIKNLKCNVILISKEHNNLSKLSIKKYQEQYHNLRIIYNDMFHDRYFIIDKNIIYHCGTSINHAGSRTFSINMLEDKLIKNSLINNINSLINREKT